MTHAASSHCRQVSGTGTLSTRRAHSVLGFEPKWHLKDGYKRYCEWYAGEWERAQYRSNAA